MQNLESLKGDLLGFCEYCSALTLVPISTVDFVVTKLVDGKKKFLLVKRNEGAYANEWFVLGGRQMRGESVIDALLRVAKREAGLDSDDIVSMRFSHCQDVYNPESENHEGDLPAWHSIWHFYVIEASSNFIPKTDSTSSECGWFDRDTVPQVPGVVSQSLENAKHLLV